MTIQSDKWIRNMAKSHEMINPFEENQIRDNKISYGLSSYGYDARVSNEFKVSGFQYPGNVCWNPSTKQWATSPHSGFIDNASFKVNVLNIKDFNPWACSDSEE